MRDLCTRHGALLLFDEVMTGFRVHPGGAAALYGVTPDLITLGKTSAAACRSAPSAVAAIDAATRAGRAGLFRAGTLSGNCWRWSRPRHLRELADAAFYDRMKQYTRVC